MNKANKKEFDKENIEVTKSTESVLSEPEKRLRALINGAEPLNDSEKRMIQQIKDIEANGDIIDIPFM